MPELPDLEVARKYVNATSLHQKIRSVEVRDARILGNISARGINNALTGRRLEATRRHGKNLFVGSDGGGWMLVHLGMTGRLWYFRGMVNDPPHDRFLISFEGGHYLALDDSRMFGKVDLVEDPDEYIRRKKLGPDPLSLDAASFPERGGVQGQGIGPQLLAPDVLVRVFHKVHLAEHSRVVEGEVMAAFEGDQEPVVRRIIDHTAEVPEASGHAQVHEHPAPAVRSHEEVLAVAAGSLQPATGERVVYTAGGNVTEDSPVTHLHGSYLLVQRGRVHVLSG